MNELNEIGHSDSVSAKEYISGRRRAVATLRHGTRTALYLRVSTADQKPDLQYDDLCSYAGRAGLDIVRDYCDVAVSGRREGRPQLNALMAAARKRETDWPFRKIGAKSDGKGIQQLQWFTTSLFYQPIELYQ